MRSWSLRISTLGLMLVAFVGCDSNPEGPAAPTVSNPNASIPAPTTTPGVMPTKTGPRAPGTNAPLKAD